MEAYILRTRTSCYVSQCVNSINCITYILHTRTSCYGLYIQACHINTLKYHFCEPFSNSVRFTCIRCASGLCASNFNQSKLDYLSESQYRLTNKDLGSFLEHLGLSPQSVSLWFAFNCQSPKYRLFLVILYFYYL